MIGATLVSHLELRTFSDNASAVRQTRQQRPRIHTRDLPGWRKCRTGIVGCFRPRPQRSNTIQKRAVRSHAPCVISKRERKRNVGNQSCDPHQPADILIDGIIYSGRGGIVAGSSHLVRKDLLEISRNKWWMRRNREHPRVEVDLQSFFDEQPRCRDRICKRSFKAYLQQKPIRFFWSEPIIQGSKGQQFKEVRIRFTEHTLDICRHILRRNDQVTFSPRQRVWLRVLIQKQCLEFGGLWSIPRRDANVRS